jgi:hypothetical protein
LYIEEGKTMARRVHPEERELAETQGWLAKLKSAGQAVLSHDRWFVVGGTLSVLLSRFPGFPKAGSTAIAGSGTAMAVGFGKKSADCHNEKMVVVERARGRYEGAQRTLHPALVDTARFSHIAAVFHEARKGTKAQSFWHIDTVKAVNLKWYQQAAKPLYWVSALSLSLGSYLLSGLRWSEERSETQPQTEIYICSWLLCVFTLSVLTSESLNKFTADLEGSTRKSEILRARKERLEALMAVPEEEVPAENAEVRLLRQVETQFGVIDQGIAELKRKHQIEMLRLDAPIVSLQSDVRTARDAEAKTAAQEALNLARIDRQTVINAFNTNIRLLRDYREEFQQLFRNVLEAPLSDASFFSERFAHKIQTLFEQLEADISNLGLEAEDAMRGLNYGCS